MYPGDHAITRAEQPALIMAQTGESLTYGELEVRTNRLAHLLRARGLRRLDHYAIFMENNARYIECCGAGERTGLYYTCVNSYLTPDELVYILNNSQSKVLITSEAKRDVAAAALQNCPNIELCLVVDGKGDGGRFHNLDQATAPHSIRPVIDESLGRAMLYSSGTTGRPKGVLRPLWEEPPSWQDPLTDFVRQLWRYRAGMIYLSPAPFTMRNLMWGSISPFERVALPSLWSASIHNGFLS
jgi:long-chain acyl-CoA synthetase